MLHDSPRSSRLHIETMQYLSQEFCVYALDTPGYGNSEPLDQASPTIADFADALGAALAALGLSHAPLYATHTSAKIALEHAARTGQPCRLILDGLSIPEQAADVAFIDQYMRPFTIDGSGAYLAAEWTRMRDMVRWFPWFDQRPQTRMAIATPTDGWIADYIIDFFAAGPNYAAAYAAAMRYDPKPALLKVKSETLIAAKESDVLYAHLARVPTQDNAALTVERLGSDRSKWLAWLERSFREASQDKAVHAAPPQQPVQRRIYADLPHGPMLVNRAGPQSGTPLLILSAPTTLHALRWQQALSTRATIVPDLPGFGESAALPSPSLISMADALEAMLDQFGIGKADILATGFATPLGTLLAARHPAKFGHIILDGCFSTMAINSDSICPEFPFDTGGGHIHRYWHMLRDGEANWPWYATEATALRTIAPQFDAFGLHDALLGILKQPEHYGDAVGALAQIDNAESYSAFSQPALLFSRPDDPGYGAVTNVAGSLPSARALPRPDTIEDAAAAVETFLTAFALEGAL
ncbi:alpha/beta fold hydrolase [Sphingobium boeckii]|uniref:Pimeloyl-ACP methyl ester carboxylesterase n=1 Tax=Sphingobium boeckii TaxID=1082345 RepID=A0A7W9AL64_9SPHN|nr:alpha/beta fold hydrolase [Sphingobium boeckii]MBB5687698.1 pimeloyl-ACP methyl ester carboxylesterase [Sphingobium boeckii]